MEKTVYEPPVEEDNKSNFQLLHDLPSGKYINIIEENISEGKLYLSKIKDIINEINVVPEKTPLFSNESNLLSSDEENEDNASLDSSSKNILLHPEFDCENQNITKIENTYYSKTKGIFLIKDEVPKVIPIICDTLFDVRLSEDKVCVILDLYPPCEQQGLPKLEDILNKINTLGDISEIDNEIINNSINVLSQRKEALKEVIVSMGEYPVDGKDEWLEIKIQHKYKEEINDNNFANKQSEYLSVGKDQLIAEIHPPIEGCDGSDVFGNVILHQKAKSIKVKQTSNIYFGEENENLIYSKIDGFLEIYENLIYVKELLEIKGNVDVNTGNIEAFGSIIVYGDVVKEAKINLSQNLEVRGYVGDAEIEVGNNAIVKGGFLGSGHGFIKAGGDLELKFVENQKIYSRGTLNISKEAINSELYVKDKIISSGSHFAVIGGYAIASESIELYSAGNEFNTTTVLEVGIDYLKKFSLRSFSQKLESFKKEIELVDGKIIELSSVRRKSPKMCEKIKTLALRHTEIAKEIELIKTRKNRLNEEINSPTESKIIVKNLIYPGVKLVINGSYRIIKEKMRDKTFILSKENEIISQ